MRALLLICLLLLNTAVAEDRLQVEGYPLENGLQLLLKPTADRGHVSIRLVVGVGFDQFGCRDKELPHLLEHLLFSGIDDSGEAGLEAKMQALGGDWNAYTRDSDTAYVLEVPARSQRAALDLLLASLVNTELTAEKLAAAQQVIERENGGHYSNLQRLLDRQNTSRDAHQQLAVELGLECPERAQVDHLQLAQLERLRQDWYVPNNMTLIVVGDLDPLLPAYLERSYGDLPAGSVPEARELPEVRGEAAERRTLITGLLGDTASLHWLLPEPWVGDHDHETWELLRDYLDWQLYQTLRLEQPLSYGPWSARNVFGTSSFFSLNVKLERQDRDRAEQAMRQLGARLSADGLDARTFERLRHVALARLAWATQGNSALADYYWNALGDYQDGRFSDPAIGLRAVTLEQANEAVRLLFKTPGYLRTEQALLSSTQLYAAVAVFGALLLGGLVGWWRRRARATP
ncbi:M16 family metallopeptidase [Pseudomonas sp.]|uniref:M16 family metallopeptidase n=1 Tax=Pseudomonas sp. TaxID=306 RepID=UPI003D1257E6